MVDDRRYIVGMRVNTVATQTADADVLGEREHKNTGKVNEPTWSSRGDSGGKNH